MPGRRSEQFNPRGDDVNLRSGPQMEEYRAIVERLRNDGIARVLDWGCGLGQVSDLLDRAGLQVSSFDYRPGQEPGVQTLEHFPRLSAFISHDSRRLPYDDASFDAVLSCGVLEHVEDPDASLEEIHRVLVPGGRFYAYKLPNRASYLEAIARRAGLYYHGKQEHDRLYTLATAVELVGRHGFAVEEARRMNVLPLTITGSAVQRMRVRIWRLNRALSSVPGLNLVATNVEVVARRG